MAALASFTRFRLWVEFGSDPAHGTTASQFVEDQQHSETPIWGHYVQNLFEMKDAAGSFATRERGLFGIHWINTTSGVLDVTWTSADFASVESAVQTCWTGLGGWISSDMRLVEHRWYGFGPGVVKPNPPVRITTLGTPIVGSAGIRSPHQVGSTVTFRTPLRRHWGRIYLPTNGATLAAGGVLSNSDVDTIASTARTMVLSPESAQGVVPVVWDRNHHRAYGVRELEVDNVLDIQRRRRIRTSTYKKIYAA